MKKSIAWSVDADAHRLTRLQNASIDLEAHLEEWIKSDPSLVSDDLLLSAQQPQTAHGKVLDLLGIDSTGDLVVVEIKRAETLRDTVGQGIEYAAWASGLGVERIVEIASGRFGSEEGFRAAFAEKFGHEVPETLNQKQSIYLVAPMISDFTASGITYLSEKFSLPINGISFDVFEVDGRRILVKQVVVDEEPPPPPTSKRQITRTMEDFETLAEENGVDDMYHALLTLKELFPSIERSATSFNFRAVTPDGKSRAVLSVYPTALTTQDAVDIYFAPFDQLVSLFGNPREDCQELIGTLGGKSNSRGWTLVRLKTLDDASNLVQKVREFAANAPFRRRNT